VSLGVAVAALLATLLGGCGPISALIHTQQALTNAGYQSVSVNFNVGNQDQIKVSVTVNATPSATNSDDVAHVVWDKFHERFSLLSVTVHGSGPAFQRDYSYSDLVSLFGPRNPAYDKTSVSSATQQLGLIVVIVIVVLILGVVLTVIMVRRRRRGRTPPWTPGGPPWTQGGPPPGGGAPPPWVQGGPNGVPQYPQQPASYPMWPPPQGPPPGVAPRPDPVGYPPPDAPGEAQHEDPPPVWPPAPPPPNRG
jgi:hypothetical protein